MKRLILAILVGLCMVSPSLLYAAAGSSTTTSSKIMVDNKVQRVIVTIAWTGGTGVDAGTIPNVTITPATYGVEGWYLYSVETNPGAVAPTDNYDLVINDADGKDIAGGLLANRDLTNTELVLAGLGGFGFPIVRGPLTLVLSGNSVESSTGTIIIIFIN